MNQFNFDDHFNRVFVKAPSQKRPYPFQKVLDDFYELLSSGVSVEQVKILKDVDCKNYSFSPVIGSA